MSNRKARKLGYFEEYCTKHPSCVVSMVAILGPSRDEEEAKEDDVPTTTSEGMETLRVQIPNNVQPGEEFQVYVGGRIVRIRCPLDSKPGQTLQITVPVDRPSSSIQKTPITHIPVTCPENAMPGQEVRFNLPVALWKKVKQSDGDDGPAVNNAKPIVPKQQHRMTDEQFRRGVEYISRRHPHLRSVLINNDGIGEQYLRVLDQPPLLSNHMEIVTMSNDDDWKPIIQEDANIGFDLESNSPYWKVVLLRGPTIDVLLVKYHHCIADGTSGYILIDDIMKAAFGGSNDSTDDYVVNSDDPLPMLPPIEDMCFPNGYSEDDEEFIQGALGEAREKQLQWIPSLEYSPNPPKGNKHSILYRDGTEQNLKALLLKCRSLGVTIGSVLGAATFFTGVKMKNKDNNKAGETGEYSFDFDMDVNLRKRLPNINLGSDHIGAHIGMMSFNLNLTKDTKFWDFVAQFKNAIEVGLKEKQPFHYFEVNRRLDGMLEEEPLNNKAWKEDDGHTNDMNFSNIAQYPFCPNYGHAGVEKIYCVGGGWCPIFGAYVFLIPSVHYLNFSCVYETADVNHAVASEFFNAVCDLTENAANISDTFTLEEYMF